MSAASNLFVTTDKVHPYKNWIDVFCQNLGVQNLAGANSHFYIEGMDPMYIPNDGNCVFHGLDYLIGQKTKSLARFIFN